MGKKVTVATGVTSLDGARGQAESLVRSLERAQLHGGSPVLHCHERTDCRNPLRTIERARPGDVYNLAALSEVAVLYTVLSRNSGACR